jgi:N-terminal domain of oxidoreductase
MPAGSRGGRFLRWTCRGWRLARRRSCPPVQECNAGLEPWRGEIVSLRAKEVSMVARVNRQILLKSRPEGMPSLDNFTLKQGSVPEPRDGEVLMRTRWLSLDPYMRGRMSAAKSYAKPVEVGATMVGGTVGEVVASRGRDSFRGL